MPQLIFHPIYSQLSLPVKHRFPIQKYQGIYDVLRTEGVVETDFLAPVAVPPEDLMRVFSPAYLKHFLHGTMDNKAMRRIGFPWSEQLVKRTLTAVGGTLLTAKQALDKGWAINLTGGYHHAFANFGSGFCIINDLYLAALQMRQSADIDRVLIFDCDVHQGDGTAKLAANHPYIKTVSLHAEKNFPYRKQRSDLDFPLPAKMDDSAYLEVVDEALHIALAQFNPDAIIYDAGVDIHIDDDLGHLCVTTEGIYARDCLVRAYSEKAGIPIAAVIGGGYQRDISKLVEVHKQLFRAFNVVS